MLDEVFREAYVIFLKFFRKLRALCIAETDTGSHRIAIILPGWMHSYDTLVASKIS